MSIGRKSERVRAERLMEFCPVGRVTAVAAAKMPATQTGWEEKGPHRTGNIPLPPTVGEHHQTKPNRNLPRYPIPTHDLQRLHGSRLLKRVAFCKL